MQFSTALSQFPLLLGRQLRARMLIEPTTIVRGPQVRFARQPDQHCHVSERVHPPLTVFLKLIADQQVSS